MERWESAQALTGLSNRGIASLGAAALLAALLLLLISAATLTFNLGHLANSRTEFARLADVLETTSETLESIRAAETGQRGFLLTGQDRYLRTYELGVPASGPTLTIWIRRFSTLSSASKLLTCACSPRPSSMNSRER